MKKIFTSQFRSKVFFKTLIVSVTIILLSISGKISAQRFVHPGIAFTIGDINQLKANITQEPWLSAYNSFKSDSRSQLSYKMQGPFVEVGRAPNINLTQWDNDMVAIHNLAWMWIFTGDSAYARKATDMLDIWATTNTIYSGIENNLEQGDYARYYAVGADILRGTFPNWTADNTAHVKAYFNNLFWPTTFVPYALRDHNKGALQMETALSVAAFLDDQTKWDQAIEVYRIDAGGGLRNSLPNGELGDAGRDDHWYVQADGLAWAAEVAWKQGVDLFSDLDNRLYNIAELYNKFNIDSTGIKFVPFGGYSAYYTSWGEDSGHRHQNPFNNVIENAYAKRKGIPTPYSTQMRALVGEGAGSFLYLRSSDTSTATALPPLVFPTTEAVTNLTNIDIGATGVTGSSSYSGGTWTVNGAGNSVGSVVNFTFKPVSGDVGIVAKVTSNSIRTSAMGLMIRDTLTTGSNYVSINLNGAGGITSSAKGNVSGDNGSHYQPKVPWWVKIERIGSRVFTYHSVDGINWTNNAMFNITLQNNAYIGLYTVSNNTSTLNTVNFTNVAITNSSPAGSPLVTSATTAQTTLNTSFNYNISATNAPTAYTAAGLPAGLSIDGSTGIISGISTTLGTYAVTLGASNASGTGTAILMIVVSSDVTPSTPTNLASSVVNTSNIKLTWTASANITSYSVKRSLTSGGPYTTIATGVTNSNYTDAGPTPEVNNYYVVTALAGTLESSSSNEVFNKVPPSIPGKPVVVIGSTELDLSWQPASGAASYNVKRGTTMGGPYTTIANVTATSYADMAVTSGNPYYYVISSVGATQQSGNSLEAFGVPGASFVTWQPAPNSELWSESSNWVEGYAPTSPAIITFKATNDSTLTNDIVGLQASRILFDTTASGYTITGTSLGLGNGDLINNSANAQTLNTAVVLNGPLNINANTQDVILPGTVSGTGNLTKSGASILYMTGNNTYSGNTTITGSTTGYPPTYAIGISGTGTGTSGAPTSGPLGTGKIILSGGSLFSSGGDATLYNDIDVPAGATSFIFQTTNAVNLRGRLTGGGYLRQDGNVSAGLHFFGDNSGFTGTFNTVLRSGNSRTRFEVPESGSANANWLLDANAVDCAGVTFATGTLNFGSLSGRGYIRNDGSGTPTISIGALNSTTSTNYSGTMFGSFNVDKVGTGVLIFSGNNSYTGLTTVRSGKFLLNNNGTTGSFTCPVSAVGGSFGGTGRTSAAITIGTGSGTGAILEPGNLSIGTLTTTGTLTMNADATYALQISTTVVISDTMVVNAAVLNNPVLSITDLNPGTFPLGDSLMILKNAGSAAITGTFNGLPEFSLVTVNGYSLRITYKGGDGNDIVLRDNRTVPETITSPNTANGLVGKPFTYTIAAINSPTSFSTTTLPDGLTLDPASGIISGMPTTTGTYVVTIGATNAAGAGTMVLTIKISANYSITGVFVGSGDTKDILEWDAAPAADTFFIKRSNVSGGPYTVVGKSLTNRFTDAGLTNGTSYYYVISGTTGTNETPNSSELAALPGLGQFAYYNFDELSGTRAYDYYGANDGTLMAGAARGTGKKNTGLTLNATSTAYATLPSGILSTLNDFTFSLWVNMTTLVKNARIFDFGNSTTQYMFLVPQNGATGSGVQVNFRNGSTVNSISYNGYAVPLNTWTHFAITESGTTASLYINGVLVATNTAMSLKPSSLGITTNNYIGKSQAAADPMLNGTIDEFQIFSRALSAAEISSLVTSGVLPISFISVSAVQKNSSIVVNWNMADEKGIGHYDVERSADGISFMKVGQVNPSASNGVYSWTDNAPLQANNFYRIKGVEVSGDKKYSSIVNVNIGNLVSSISCYPNPVIDNNISLHLNNMKTGNYKLMLIDNLSRQVAVKEIDHFGGSANYSIPLNPAMAKGIYHLRVVGNNEQKDLQVMLK
jgi:autotransporter-associated beta strand protein